MKAIFAAAAIAVTSFSTALRANEADCSQEVSEVLAAERAIAQAQVKGDVLAIGGLLALGYTFTVPNGRVVSREQFIEDMKNGWKPLIVENTDQSVRCTGTVVTVVGKALYRWQEKEKVESAREQYTDTYVRTQNQWRRVSSHSSCLEGRCT